MKSVGRPCGPGTMRPPSVIQPVTAYIMLPVPSVAMKESMRANSTMTPFTAPARVPPRTTARQASGQGQPSSTMRYSTSTCARPRPYPMDRSNLPLATVIVAPSARTAGMDWLERIEETFSRVGKVSGSATEKSRKSRTVRANRPYVPRKWPCPGR
ncbi:hypothetical protein GCM10020254_75840 [Streptomyces goshikiensis]